MKEKIKKPEAKETYSVIPPQFKEPVEHTDLKVISEANNMTLLRARKTGKIYVAIKDTSGFSGKQFVILQELKS